MTSTTSHSRESDSYAAPSFTSDYWPAAGKQINNEYAGFLSREAFSIKRAASGSPAEIPGPSNGKDTFLFCEFEDEMLSDNE